MGRLFILGEEHVKEDAHNAIHSMLSDNPDCLFLTEKRRDVLDLRKDLANVGNRTEEGELLSRHAGNKALQAIFRDKSVNQKNIHSIDLDGGCALFLSDNSLKEDGGFNEEMFSRLMKQEDIPAILGKFIQGNKAYEYKKLTKENERKIGALFAGSDYISLAVRELRNKVMAHNIAIFIKENPEKDLVVLCGAAHLCRTNKYVDRPAEEKSSLDSNRKSLLDFLEEKGIKDNITDIYIEDAPITDKFKYILPLIRAQIHALYKIDPKPFSSDLAGLVETVKAKKPTSEISADINIPADSNLSRFFSRDKSSGQGNSVKNGKEGDSSREIQLGQNY